jgi:hypothetical protein
MRMCSVRQVEYKIECKSRLSFYELLCCGDFFFFGVARVCDVLGVAEILEFLVTGGDICLGGVDGNNELFSSSFGVLLVFA